MLNGTIGPFDLHMTIEDDGPRVEFLALVHDDGTHLLDHGEHHDGAQRPAYCQRHVGKGL